METVSKIKTAIVGFGGMANWHYNNMLQCGLFDIVGAYDIDNERKAAIVNRKMKSYDSFKELLAENGLQLLLIATPNDWHEPYAVQALNKGLNVFCEKPVTLSSALLTNMIDAAEASGAALIVHQNRRWDKDYLIIKEMFDNNDMGGMYKVDSNVTGSHGVPGSWRRIKAKGGGMLWDWGVHLIDQMLTMNKTNVVGVTCKASYIYGFDCDDGIYMTLDFEDGFQANINIDTNNFIKTPRWYAYSRNGTAVIKGWNCSGKIIKVKTFLDKKNKGITAGNGFTKTMADRSKSSIFVKRLPKVAVERFAIYNNLYAVINNGAQPIITTDSVMRCMKVLEAGFLSMDEKKTIVTTI